MRKLKKKHKMTIINVKSNDRKFLKALLSFLYNYNAVDKDSTLITIGEEVSVSKTMWEKVLDESDPLWYNDMDEEYDTYDSQDLGR